MFAKVLLVILAVFAHEAPATVFSRRAPDGLMSSVEIKGPYYAYFFSRGFYYRGECKNRDGKAPTLGVCLEPWVAIPEKIFEDVFLAPKAFIEIEEALSAIRDQIARNEDLAKHSDVGRDMLEEAEQKLRAQLKEQESKREALIRNLTPYQKVTLLVKARGEAFAENWADSASYKDPLIWLVRAFDAKFPKLVRWDCECDYYFERRKAQVRACPSERAALAALGNCRGTFNGDRGGEARRDCKTWRAGSENEMAPCHLIEYVGEAALEAKSVTID